MNREVEHRAFSTALTSSAVLFSATEKVQKLILKNKIFKKNLLPSKLFK